MEFPPSAAKKRFDLAGTRWPASLGNIGSRRTSRPKEGQSARDNVSHRAKDGQNPHHEAARQRMPVLFLPLNRFLVACDKKHRGGAGWSRRSCRRIEYSVWPNMPFRFSRYPYPGKLSTSSPPHRLHASAMCGRCVMGFRVGVNLTSRMIRAKAVVGALIMPPFHRDRCAFIPPAVNSVYDSARKTSQAVLEKTLGF